MKPKLDTKWDFRNFLTRRNHYLRSTNIGLTQTVWVKNGPERFGTLIEQLRFGPSVQWNKFWICIITDRMDSPLRTLGTLAERSEGPWMERIRAVNLFGFIISFPLYEILNFFQLSDRVVLNFSIFHSPGFAKINSWSFFSALFRGMNRIYTIDSLWKVDWRPYLTIFQGIECCATKLFIFSDF